MDKAKKDLTSFTISVTGIGRSTFTHLLSNALATGDISLKDLSAVTITDPIEDLVEKLISSDNLKRNVK